MIKLVISVIIDVKVTAAQVNLYCLFMFYG